MKKNICEFFRRGMTASGFGPLVLVIVYLILQRQAGVEMLTVNQVCVGIVSLSVLAFIAGGMNVIYQIEQIPLMVAILIHGVVLYISYLATYLLNDWLEQGMTPILMFSGIFIIGYFAVWAVIYFVTKRRTERINEILKRNQQRYVDKKRE